MVTTQTLVLSGFLLVTGENGQLCPAINDFSGQPLFAGDRLEAAKILAEKGHRFFCVGIQEQTDYFRRVLPGTGHFAVENPNKYEPNTPGNAQQLFSLGERGAGIQHGLFNLYHTYRWFELAKVRGIPAEAVLLAEGRLKDSDLRKMYGRGPAADKLLSITRACAGRIQSGELGDLTTEELGMFEEVVKLLPTSTHAGPARERVPPEIIGMFQGSYLSRVLDELLGVADIRAKTYISLRPSL